MTYHVIMVEFTVKPGAQGEFERIMVRTATSSIEDEPGCLRFDVLRRLDAPDVIVLYEIYADAEAFAAHVRTPHYAEFDAASKPLVLEKRVLAAGFVPGSPPAKAGARP